MLTRSRAKIQGKETTAIGDVAVGIKVLEMELFLYEISLQETLNKEPYKFFSTAQNLSSLWLHSYTNLMASLSSEEHSPPIG